MGSTVVCGLDVEDDAARTVLDVAADLAERLALPLVVAHVAPWVPLLAGGSAAGGEAAIAAPAPAIPYPMTPGAGELDAVRDEARRRVEQLLAQYGLDDAQVEVALDATIADGLRRIAADRGAKLLVVGSRGRGAIRAALLGSTSHALVGDCPCPVVVIPGSDASD